MRKVYPIHVIKSEKIEYKEEYLKVTNILINLPEA